MNTINKSLLKFVIMTMIFVWKICLVKNEIFFSVHVLCTGSLWIFYFVSSTGDTCLSPEVKAETYTTTEAIVSTETVFVVQFSLTCKNKVRVSKQEICSIYFSIHCSDSMQSMFSPKKIIDHVLVD